jgi:chromosome segregation ATPase
LKASQGQN